MKTEEKLLLAGLALFCLWPKETVSSGFDYPTRAELPAGSDPDVYVVDPDQFFY